LKCCTCHAKTAITCSSKKKSLAAVKNERSYCHKRLGHLTATSEVRALPQASAFRIWDPKLSALANTLCLPKALHPANW